MEEQIVQGTLSPLLLQPLDPGWRFVLGHVTERFARLPFVALIIAIGFWLYPQALWVPEPKHAALAFAALVVAFAVRFLLQYAVAMLSFWSERASAIEEVWFSLFIFLSGMLAPLDFYPPIVRNIAEFTPFPYMVYVPAELLLGHDVPLFKAAVVLSGWGVGSFVLNRVLWRQGLKRYSAMGA
jgi:ABC-2 type transport system permease protein